MTLLSSDSQLGVRNVMRQTWKCQADYVGRPSFGGNRGKKQMLSSLELVMKHTSTVLWYKRPRPRHICPLYTVYKMSSRSWTVCVCVCVCVFFHCKRHWVPATLSSEPLPENRQLTLFFHLKRSWFPVCPYSRFSAAAQEVVGCWRMSAGDGLPV